MPPSAVENGSARRSRSGRDIPIAAALSIQDAAEPRVPFGLTIPGIPADASTAAAEDAFDSERTGLDHVSFAVTNREVCDAAALEASVITHGQVRPRWFRDRDPVLQRPGFGWAQDAAGSPAG